MAPVVVPPVILLNIYLLPVVATVVMPPRHITRCPIASLLSSRICQLLIILAPIILLLLVLQSVVWSPVIPPMVVLLQDVTTLVVLPLVIDPADRRPAVGRPIVVSPANGRSAGVPVKKLMKPLDRVIVD